MAAWLDEKRERCERGTRNLNLVKPEPGFDKVTYLDSRGATTHREQRKARG